MLTLNGNPLLPAPEVEIDGVVYSYATLLHMSPKDRAYLGVGWTEPEPPTPDWPSLAMDALRASDLVAVRAVKAGIAYPLVWQAYDDALRAIVNGAPGPLPEQPGYPE